MTLKGDLTAEVAAILREQWDEETTTVVPGAEDLRLNANHAKNLMRRPCSTPTLMGLRAFVIEASHMGEALAKRSHDANPGMLALSGNRLSIFAAYGAYATQRAWWDVTSSKRVDGEGRRLLAA